jgi:cell division transport system permease protein
LRNQTGITAVDYPQQWVERLGLMALTVGWTKWLVGGVLFLVTFFVVTSMVKLAVALRRQEIEILQLVGATQATIQAPYVLAGLIQGMAGACLALGMLAMTYYILREHIVAVLGLLVPVSAIYFLDGESAALIVAAGALLGAAGALFGLRRFVRTWKPLKLSR